MGVPANEKRHVQFRPLPIVVTWIGVGVLALVVAGCAFDDSRLAASCTTDDQCAGGVCVQGFCVGPGGGLVDVGNPDGPAFDPDAREGDGAALSDTDPTPDQGAGDVLDDGGPGDDPEPDPDPNPDAGDDPDPGDLGDDGGPGDDPDPGDLGDDACASPNVCGGCGPLPAEPGDPCATATCGLWTCTSAGTLECAEGPVNACDGCAPLGGSPGDLCGACDGELVCDGLDALSCLGGEANACGGCGGLPGELGDPCGCGEVELSEAHTLVCLADQTVCDDANDARAGATVLPDASDVMQEPAFAAGALIDGDAADWFVVTVIDEAATNGMFPDVLLTGLSGDHDLCAFFDYVDRGPPEIDCASGSSATRDGLPGCCSSNDGDADELVRLRNGSIWSDRLDTTNGAGNDDAIVYIEVTGEPATACAPYELSYQF